MPLFMTDDFSYSFGGQNSTSPLSQQYLWGNTPAVDVVRLDKNEGVDFNGPLSLLFAGKHLAA